VPIWKLIFRFLIDIIEISKATYSVAFAFILSYKVLPAAHNTPSPALLPLMVLPMAGLGFICGFWFAMGKCREKTFPQPGLGGWGKVLILLTKVSPKVKLQSTLFIHIN
jgi:hypothetical protein